jgi:hypothetical protein
LYPPITPFYESGIYPDPGTKDGQQLKRCDGWLMAAEPGTVGNEPETALGP